MQTAPKSKFRVLVVDDEPAVGHVVELMLRFEGHEVQVANHGKEALALLEQNAFDLVIVDYAMPDMKGDELAALIKQARPKQIVIMLSALADAINISDKNMHAVDAIMAKPFMLEDLRAIMAGNLNALPPPE